jgi:hypothetical protein
MAVAIIRGASTMESIVKLASDAAFQHGRSWIPEENIQPIKY